MSLVSVSSSQIITINRTPPRTSGPVAVLAPRRGRWVDWVRLAFAVALLLAALTTVVPAPIYEVWPVALVATEGGHWLVPIALLTLLPGWQRKSAGRWGAVVGLVSAALFAAPLVRALNATVDLDSELERVWGDAEPLRASGLDGRERPIELLDLFTGLPIGASTMRTLTYASDAAGERRLDLYLPANAARNLPLVVLVHGGAWRVGRRSELPALARYLASRGIAVIAPDYRLAPAHRFPAARDDILAAMDFVRARADSLGIDSDRVAFIGRSAGAQVAVAAAIARAHDPSIRGAVSLYGPLDLHWGYANPGNRRVIDGRAVVRDYLGGAPNEVPAVYDAASPVALVDTRTPPVLLLHGARDDLVSPEHSERFVARMDWADRPHFLIRMPWATHGCDAILRGPCGQVTVFAVERFLSGVFRGP
jgi:acetyl esterase/lipase